MIAQQSGRIINVSSPFARVGVTGRFAYSATKAGLEQLTRSLAVDWAASGITVNSVVPATVLTETRAEAFAEDQTRRARITQIPLGRLGRAEDIVGPVLLLAGPAGEFITGQTIVADGGYTTVRF
jgi:2-deoxy-D-gluconate 3-dehydrogenase